MLSLEEEEGTLQVDFIDAPCRYCDNFSTVFLDLMPDERTTEKDFFLNLFIFCPSCKKSTHIQNHWAKRTIGDEEQIIKVAMEFFDCPDDNDCRVE